MIMFIGDGIGRTVIKANRSYADGWTAFHSATVGVRGSGFIAKDLSFVNYAGLANHQAVALRSSSDLSAFYRCSFESYQDTLYVHSHKQFYRECDIYGTVDFIFGDASVVFQNCSLYARRPNPNQKIIYTAQGRENSSQPTGISIISSKILAAPDLIPVQANFKAYLGRPWQLYSRTVIMKSFIGDLVDPAGWLKWKDNFALETLYYGEYMNEGPGSNMTNRVQWPGFKRIETAEEATQFSVGPFIEEFSHVDVWIRKEYEVVGSWTKLFRVLKPESVESLDFVRPLIYSKDMSNILLEINNAKNLMWFDLPQKSS
ncbi:Pectin lyase fold/virulence factor [Arabidopsis thaliana x Arabidopsis arenosa]|uniref:Pectinesterase n=1 Tax=Arabidopsis thaliana x Arabidopsis arenosa TaxID=1240361 RepID=A0A8T1Z584_9BRAS|nr:Pectin lyase fold/virulence factor [Arabidopsis thaliana x Arabidopsis arenosa]